jgi:hypothetical protein
MSLLDQSGQRGAVVPGSLLCVPREDQLPLPMNHGQPRELTISALRRLAEMLHSADKITVDRSLLQVGRVHGCGFRFQNAIRLDMWYSRKRKPQSESMPDGKAQRERSGEN